MRTVPTEAPITGAPPCLSDGKLLALYAGPKKVSLLDAATGQDVATLPAGNPLTFSSDGSLLAALADNGVVQIWDLHRLRLQLAGLELDWDQQTYPSPKPDVDRAVRKIEVDQGRP